jgi:hypothetical protein
VSLSATAIDCASIDLAAEPHDSLDAPFEDRGGNACGCPTATNTCKALSSGLEPPSEL